MLSSVQSLKSWRNSLSFYRFSLTHHFLSFPPNFDNCHFWLNATRSLISPQDTVNPKTCNQLNMLWSSCLPCSNNTNIFSSNLLPKPPPTLLTKRNPQQMFHIKSQVLRYDTSSALRFFKIIDHAHKQHYNGEASIKQRLTN